MRRGARLPLASIVLATILAVFAAVVPPAAGPATPFLGLLEVPAARAAGGLAVETKTRYVVVPSDGVIRVTVSITATNETPNETTGGAITRFYYDVVNLGVQPEARRFRASSGGADLAVSTAGRDGYRLVSVRLPRDLYFGQDVTVRLAYDLPAGAPRSSSDVRVGSAFASFVAWALGDRGTVRVDVPSGFDVGVAGADMERTATDAGTQVYRASASSAVDWYAWVTARNDEGLSRDVVELGRGQDVVVRAWPEDSRWRRRVSDVLRDGIPELVTRLGLAWPVDGPLDVLEIHAPLLEGYAGFYDPTADEITISEELDDVTIVHEASHAWFNRDLFVERWITEGLAETYAAQVVDALGGDAPGPGRVSRDAAIAFPLGSWPPPAAITSDEASDREQYGYDASFRVVREIVERGGAQGMRDVFQAASERTTAYRGEADPERSTRPNDWRRFLDLTEELAGAEGVASILRKWALTADEAASLDAREAARAVYAELVAAGGTWAAPAVVRRAMDEWAFDDATEAAGEAVAILARRDEIGTLATAEGLRPPGALEGAYEGAVTPGDLASAAALADDTASSLGLVAAADDAVAAPRDWLVDLGLSGADPDADLAAARAAWEAGELDASSEAATLAIGTLAVAPDAGRARAVVIGGSVALVLLLVVVVVLLLVIQRSRRRQRALAAAAGPSAVSPSSPVDEDTPPVA